jgi:hypothetical protein
MPRNHTVEVTRLSEGTWVTTPVVSPGDTLFLRFKGDLAADVTGVTVEPGPPKTDEPLLEIVHGIDPGIQGDSFNLKIQLKNAQSGSGGICIKTQPPPH